MQRLTLSYLAGYLLVGGLGFLVAPDVALRLLLSNGAYGDIMPRVVGLFMLVLGGFILQFVRARDYLYYVYAVVARSFISTGADRPLLPGARPVVPRIGCDRLDR